MPISTVPETGKHEVKTLAYRSDAKRASLNLKAVHEA